LSKKPALPASETEGTDFQLSKIYRLSVPSCD
jgi:hypothetical protein